MAWSTGKVRNNRIQSNRKIVSGRQSNCPGAAGLFTWHDFFRHFFGLVLSINLKTNRFFIGYLKILKSLDIHMNRTWYDLLTFNKLNSKITLSDGTLERIASKRRFHVEDEIFNMDDIYDELLSSVKSCRPDDEMSHSVGLKPNSSIRYFTFV